MSKRYLLLISFFLSSYISFAQLSNFSLLVNTTNETCTGNGTLNFIVSGTVSGSTMSYSVFLLPNLGTPYAVVTTGNTLTGLNAGSYLVIATQTLGVNSGTKQNTITILNNISNLSFTTTSQKVKCGNDGIIIVNVNAGNPASYQLSFGPVTTGLQSSNVFNNLPVGNYQIRVFDTCGNAVVQSFTLLQENVGLTVLPSQIVDGSLNCNSLIVNHSFLAPVSSIIAFPLTFEFTVFPPSGGLPIVTTQVISNTSSTSVSQTIQYYYNQMFTYNLKVTDACLNQYVLNNNSIFISLDTNSSISTFCNNSFFEIDVASVISSFSVEFLSTPSGFNPTLFNANYPGPYIVNSLEFGSATNPVPVGNYSYKITDSCGRSIIKNFTINNPSPQTPTYNVSSNGCGALQILTGNTISMISAIITSAPAAYTGVLPNNISSLIVTSAAGSTILLNSLPAGNYVFSILDSCNNSHILSITVPIFQTSSININERPGCNNGIGSLSLSYLNNFTIASLSVVSAPNTFVNTLPFNINSFSNSTAFLGNLPAGQYTFRATNTCGGTQNNTITINGYTELVNTVQIEKFCSSFNLNFQHTSNSGTGQSFWLQKFDAINNTWEHPITGNVYTSGTPTSLNAIQINSNSIMTNLLFFGQLRIVKVSQVFVDSDPFITSCIKIINTFEVNALPKIESFDLIACNNGNTEVIINASGVNPIIYSITTKNGIPFLVNNGNLNVFSNLQAGIYNFQILDGCGNITNTIKEVLPINTLQIIPNSICNGQTGNLSVQNYPFLIYEWWKANDVSTILSTTNVLTFNPFNSATNSGTYFVRITNPSNATSCFNTVLSFNINSISSNPQAGNDKEVFYCGSPGILNLNSFLSGNFNATGNWTTTNTTLVLNQNTWNTNSAPFGNYIFKYTVLGFCNAIDEAIIIININENPSAPTFPNSLQICKGELVSISAGLNPPNTYFWIGPNGFTLNSNVLEIQDVQLINNGNYQVKIVSNGCESEWSNFNLEVITFPEFVLNENCLNNQKVISIAPLNNSFNLNDVQIAWTLPNGMTTNDLTVIANETGDYQVQISKFNCSETKNITVNQINCNIPTGISPNNDGKNDTFDLTGLNVKKLKIFSRWGREVFWADNYINQWYGQDYHNRILPTATYYYLIEFNNGELKSGWVYVMR